MSGLRGSLSAAQSAEDALRRESRVLAEIQALRVEVRELRLLFGDQATEVGTKPAARLLGVRPSTLAELADEAIAAGVARDVGAGTARRHMRWSVARLPAWWQARRELRAS